MVIGNVGGVEEAIRGAGIEKGTNGDSGRVWKSNGKWNHKQICGKSGGIEGDFLYGTIMVNTTPILY